MCINRTTAARRVDAGLQRVFFQICRDPCWIPEYCVRFDVPSAVTVPWDVTPCNLIHICQRSEGTCFIRQDGGRRLLRNTEKIYQTTPCRIPKYFFFKQWPAMVRSLNGRPVTADAYLQSQTSSCGGYGGQSGTGMGLFILNL